MNEFIKIIAVKALLVFLVVTAYLLARLPEAEDAHSLGDQFNIERIPLPFNSESPRKERIVHPSIKRLAAWVSSSGSAVAVADLNLDGYSNEIVLCEPRTDEILLYRVGKGGSIEGPRTIFTVSDIPAVMVDERPVAFAPIGVLTADLNTDGWCDILVFFMGRSPVILWQRPPAGRWQKIEEYNFVTEDLLPEPQIWNSNTAIASDLNGDTYLDIIIGNYGTDGIHYLDPLDGLEGGRGPRPTAPDSMSRAFNGGANRYFCWMPEENRLEPVEPAIMRLKDSREVPVSEREYIQISEAWTLAIAAVDLNGDLLPELYFANDFGPDRFFLNRSDPEGIRFVMIEGDRDIRTPRSKVLGHDSFKGMGVDFADLNGDQHLDMFVSNLTTEFAFEESHFLRMSHADYKESLARGMDPYEERSETMGVARSHWAWDAKFADLNNDGVFEILQATGFVDGTENRWARFHELVMSNDALVKDPTRWPNLRGLGNDGLAGNARNSIFVYDKAQERFFDIAEVMDFMQGPAEVGRGVALADFDRDGDQDFVFSNQWEDSYIFLNRHLGEGSRDETQPSEKRFLALDIYFDRQSSSNQVRLIDLDFLPMNLSIGVGAVVRVWEREENGRGKYIGMDYVDGGNGYTGQNAPGVHIAVPEARGKSLEVEVSWMGSPLSVRQHTLQLPPGYHAVSLPVSSDQTAPGNKPIVVHP